MDKLAEKIARRFKAENNLANDAPSEEGGHVAVAPEGWEETVKEMKKDPDIENPWALAHWMKGEGYESHKDASYLRFANEMMKRQTAE